jgi:hypothetical protein
VRGKVQVNFILRVFLGRVGFAITLFSELGNLRHSKEDNMVLLLAGLRDKLCSCKEQLLSRPSKSFTRMLLLSLSADVNALVRVTLG